jgi:hypothetical protein
VDPLGLRASDLELQVNDSCFVPNSGMLPTTGGGLPDAPPATPVHAEPTFCGEAPAPAPTTTTPLSDQQLVDQFAAQATSRRNVGEVKAGCNPGLGCVSQGLYGPPSTQWAGAAGIDVWIDVQKVLRCTGTFCGMGRLETVVLHEMAHGVSAHVFGNLVYPGTLTGVSGALPAEEARLFLAAEVATTSSPQQYMEAWEQVSDCIAQRWGAPGAFQYNCPANFTSLVDRILAP